MAPFRPSTSSLTHKWDSRCVTRAIASTFVLSLPHRQGRLCLESSWAGHDLEAWVARWDAWRPRCLYSGGDDSAFCWCAPPLSLAREQFPQSPLLICPFFGQRTGFWQQLNPPCDSTGAPACASWDTASQAPAFRLRKAHSAGVCAVACSPHEEFVLATGAIQRLNMLRSAFVRSRAHVLCALSLVQCVPFQFSPSCERVHPLQAATTSRFASGTSGPSRSP